MKHSESYSYFKKTLISYIVIYSLACMFMSLVLLFAPEMWRLLLLAIAFVFILISPFLIMLVINLIKSKKSEKKDFEIGKIMDLYPIFNYLPRSVLYAKVKLENGEVIETHPLFPIKDIKELKGKEIQISRKNKSNAYVMMVFR